VLPHEAIAKCDIRLVEAQTAQEILAKVKAHVQRHAPDVTVTSHGGMDPSKTPLDSPYTEPLRQAMTVAQGAACTGQRGQLAQLRLYQNSGHPSLLRPLCQRGRG